MARRGLKKNPTLDADVEKLIGTLRRSHPDELEASLLEHDYPALLELRGQARIEKLTDLFAELRDIQEAARRRRREAGAPDDPELAAGEKRTAAAQRRYEREATRAAERPRRRTTRRGAGPGTQTVETTENILIRKGYRGYSYELEEITPNRWEVALTYEPIDVLEGQPSVKDVSFEIFNDPDVASRRVKREIDKVLTWFDRHDIQPRRTKRKASKKKKAGRPGSRVVGTQVVPSGREARRLAEQEAIDVDIRAGRSARAERIRSYEHLGYDPRAGKRDNLERMTARIEELRDEMRVTRDVDVRKEMGDTIDVIKSMIRRVRAGKDPIQKAKRGKRLSKAEQEMAESYGELTKKGNPTREERRARAARAAKEPRPKKVKTLAAFKKLPPGTVVTIRGYTGRTVAGPRRHGQGLIGFYATGSDMYESNEKAGYDPLMSGARYYFEEDLEELIKHGTKGDAWLGNPKKKPKKGRKLPAELPPGTKITKVPPGKAETEKEYQTVRGYGKTHLPGHFHLPNPKRIRRLPKKQRDALPSRAFGLPSKRAYPMPNLAHARIAIIDAEVARRKGDITQAEYKRVVRKAEAIIEAALHAALAPNPRSLPHRRSKNPKPFWEGVFGESDAKDAARKWERDAETEFGRWERSKKRKKPDTGSLLNAYDALEMARANYYLADDKSKSGEMSDMKNKLREQVLDTMEPREVIIPEVLGKGTHARENPSSREHLKTGKDYLKKSERYWDRYYKKGKPGDLIDAYKYMVLAHDELKYGGDRRALDQVKRGMKAAQAELKLGLAGRG